MASIKDVIVITSFVAVAGGLGVGAWGAFGASQPDISQAQDYPGAVPQLPYGHTKPLPNYTKGSIKPLPTANWLWGNPKMNPHF